MMMISFHHCYSCACLSHGHSCPYLCVYLCHYDVCPCRDLCLCCCCAPGRGRGLYHCALCLCWRICESCCDFYYSNACPYLYLYKINVQIVHFTDKKGEIHTEPSGKLTCCVWRSSCGPALYRGAYPYLTTYGLIYASPSYCIRYEHRSRVHFYCHLPFPVNNIVIRHFIIVNIDIN